MANGEQLVGCRILVVEDDESVRMLVVDVLKDLGYRVIEAIETMP